VVTQVDRLLAGEGKCLFECGVPLGLWHGSYRSITSWPRPGFTE